MLRFIKLYNDYILYFTSAEGVVSAIIVPSDVVNSLRYNSEFIFNKAIDYTNAFKLHVIESDLGFYEY